MTLLPIVDRELRVAARRRASWWSRVGAATVALIIGLAVLAFMEMQRATEIGQAIFIPLSMFALAYSLFAGLWTTADCLSEEKRDGTLGLLFLTDLKGFDVVLGKLAATSIHVFYGLLAVFPVMAIPLLAGGVTGDEFLRVVLASLNNLFFSLSAGMLASAVCRDERKAMGLAFAVVVSITVLVPLGAVVYAEAVNTAAARDRIPWLSLPSPGLASVTAFNDPFKALPSPTLFTLSLAVVFGLSTVMLLTACFVTPRSWQERAVSPESSRWRRWLQSWTFGGPATRKRFRSRLLDQNPFHWLASREKNKPWLVWFFLAGIGLLWLVWAIDWRSFQPDPFHWLATSNGEAREFAPLLFGLAGWVWKWAPFEFTRAYIDESSYIASALITHTFLKIWVAFEASRRVCADRQSGALELVLCTPLSIRRILAGQFLALERQFALPVLAVLVCDVFFMLSHRADKSWMAVWFCGIVVFVVDLATLALVSLWQGLRARNSNRAASAAIVRVMVLPWLAWAGVMFLGALAMMSSSLRGNTPSWFEDDFPLGLWLVLSLLADLFFGITAWAALKTRFRQVAAQRFDRKRRWWAAPTDRPPVLPG